MPFLAVAAALGASFCWAAGALLAHKPATLLGPLALTRIQLVWAAAALVVLVTLQGGWNSVVWSHWPAFVIASIVGVVVGNFAILSCLQRGGPRRAQLLLSMNGPFAAVLGFVFLGEVLTAQKLLGGALVLAGLALAIRYGSNSRDRLEDIKGSAAVMIALGLLAAASNAVGLVFLKPAMLAGTDPLAANALRTAGGTLIVALLVLWRPIMFAPINKPDIRLSILAITPGILGYVVAVSLQLYAVRWLDAGVAVILGSAAPILILPMIWAFTGQKPRLLAWVGAMLAVTGTALILT
ncbi:DMT family transporter [Hoeflea prorocentri]|uniref:DMT family transporter n=1 Tax=Hoeflea prorocentri TaxID=1922333 RepID=A0A9X3UKW2_9HYPH|nr:DMT family transporter [Hoeflea prorocentri]MCY6381049.1 DMT family transporter [Hoeflea prorocentri]MDA5398849.1 DMT family transporter [Hoeflea prorocentri]